MRFMVICQNFCFHEICQQNCPQRIYFSQAVNSKYKAIRRNFHRNRQQFNYFLIEHTGHSYLKLFLEQALVIVLITFFCIIFARQMGTCVISQSSQEYIYTDEAHIGQLSLSCVPAEKMNSRLHKNVVVVIWRNPKFNRIGKGTGLLISKNLVLTCAHNLCHNFQSIPIQHFQVYPKQYGPLLKFYQVEAVFFPKEYISSPKTESVVYDYGIIKLKEKVPTSNFIGLKSKRQNKKSKLALYGYPQKQYRNTGFNNIEGVKQWGLEVENAIFQIRQKRGEILHTVSSLRGQSGSAIIEVQGENLSVIGIHKGGLTLIRNGEEVILNSGKLLTEEVIRALKTEAKRLGADIFTIYGDQPQKIAQDEINIIQQWANQQANSLISKGDDHKNKKQYQSAIQCYRSALERNSNGLYVLKNLGLCFAELKRWPDVVSNLNKALQLDPRNSQILTDLGIAFYECKRMQDAKLTLKRAAELDPQDSKALMYLGLAYSNPKESFYAVNSFRKAIEKDPNNSMIYYYLGYLYQQSDNKKLAISNYEKAIKLDKNNFLAYNGLAYTLFTSNKVQEAIKVYEQMIQTKPTDQSAYVSLGGIFNKSKNWQKARVYLQTAVNFNPNSSNAHSNLGKSLNGLKMWEEARDQLKKAIQIDPYNWAAYSNLGQTYNGLKEWEKAIFNQNKAIQLNPKNSMAFAHLGFALYNTFRVQDAIYYCNTAIAIDKNNAVAHNYLGLSLYSLGHCLQAIECYNTSIKLDSSYSSAYANLGFAYFIEHRWLQAQDSLRKSIKTDPSNSFALNTLGQTFINLKKWRQAIEVLTQAVKINPESSNYNFLGLAYFHSHQLQTAIKHYQQAIKLDPQNTRALTNMGIAYSKLGNIK